MQKDEHSRSCRWFHAAVVLALLIAAWNGHPLQAATTMTIGVSGGVPGISVKVPLMLHTENDVVALQADVLFDANSLISGAPVAGLASANHVVASSQPSTGVRRVLIYSANQSLLNDGTLVNLSFVVRSNVAPGMLHLSLTNVILATALGTRVLPLELTDGAITVAPPTNCTYSLSASNASFAATGSAGSVAVIAPDTCFWTVSNTNTWINILTGGSGYGSGAVTYSVASNASVFFRSGRLTIAGQLYTVTQQGSACAFALSSSNAVFNFTGGSNTVSLLTSTGCTWTVINTNPWITLTTSNGSGSGVIGYTVATDKKKRLRIGNLLIAEQPYRVIQSDTTRPTIAIISPSTKTKIFTNATVLLQGTAKDNVGVVRVEYSLNSTTNYQIASGTTNWFAEITLEPGKNKVRARSIDLSGNISAVATRIYRYNPPASAPKVANVASVARDGTGRFNFRFRVTPGHTYVLQSSTDLQRWSNIRTNVATSETLTFSDLLDKFPQRFFRVMESP